MLHEKLPEMALLPLRITSDVVGSLEMRRCIHGFVAVCLCFAVGTSSADEVEDLFLRLRPSPLDYAEWAERLLTAAETMAKDPGALANALRVLEKAHEVGLKHAKGHPTAIKAAELGLSKAKGEDKMVWQHRILAALQSDLGAAPRERKKEAGRAYIGQLVAVADLLTSSDEPAEALKLYAQASRLAPYYAPGLREGLRQRIRRARERQETLRQVEHCRQLLAARSTNVAAREELIRLCVVELDDPNEAKQQITPDVSEELRTYVPLAARGIGELAKEACEQLGDWYNSLAPEATMTGKVNVLIRARACYRRFVSLETNAARRAVGAAMLAKVEDELDKLASLRTRTISDASEFKWQAFTKAEWKLEGNSAHVVRGIDSSDVRGQLGYALLGGIDAEDYVFSARLVPRGRPQRDFGLIFRAVDADNFYYLGLYRGCLQTRRNGVWDLRPIAPFRGDISKVMVEVRLKGPSIEVFADGKLIIRVKDSTFTHGRVGLRTYTATDGGFTDVKQVVPAAP